MTLFGLIILVFFACAIIKAINRVNQANRVTALIAIALYANMSQEARERAEHYIENLK